MQMTNDNRTLFQMRVLMVVLLTATFYILVVSLLLGIAWILWVWYLYDSGFSRSVIYLILAAIYLVWPFIPRRRNFDPPGPVLEAKDHTDLFEFVNEIAEVLEQPPPETIYLTSDVNAWVAEYPKFLGIQNKRIMALGLPLVATLNVSEFHALLVHEFGHYHNGDTRLGAWIYRTRRQLMELTEPSIRQFRNGGLVLIFQGFFALYAILFLRITRSISRQQELKADVLAAELAGAKHMIGVLQKIPHIRSTFSFYWDYYVLPSIKHDVWPAFTGRFLAFMSNNPLPKKSLIIQQSNPVNKYDTHPPLNTRLKLLEAHPQSDVATQSVPALSLFDKQIISNFELEVFKEKMPSNANISAVISSEQLVSRVYIPIWKQRRNRYIPYLVDWKLIELPHLLEEPQKLRQEIRKQSKCKDSDILDTGYEFVQLLGGAMALALIRDGWSCQINLDSSIHMQKGNFKLAPFAKTTELFKKIETTETWTQFCQDSGISNLVLAQWAKRQY